MKAILIALSALALAGCMQNEYHTDIHVERIDRKHMPKEDVTVVLPPVVVPPVVDQPLMEIPTQPPLVVVTQPPPRIGHGPAPVPLPIDLGGL